MGGFYGSIHVRADSNQQIKDVLEKVAKKKKHTFYMAPPINGWVSIFPDGSGQDERVSRYIAEYIDCDIVHLLVHDDDIFCYWYYRKGKLVDEYNSNPDYFGGWFISKKKRERLKGNLDVFKDLVNDPNKIHQPSKILSESGTFKKNTYVNPEYAEKIKQFEKIGKEIQKLLYNPGEINKFISQNPHLCADKTNMEKITTAFLQSRGYLNEKGHWREDLFWEPTKAIVSKVNDKEDIKNKSGLYQPPLGLFASNTMKHSLIY